jgi:protein O-mannosyl-transferase
MDLRIVDFRRQSLMQSEVTSAPTMAATRSPTATRVERSIGLALVLLVLLSYWGVWTFDFISLDDPVYVIENPRVHGLSSENVQWALTSAHGLHWAPVSWLSFMVDHEIWGLAPGGYHLTNLVLHAIAVVLLFVALSRMTGAVWRSGLVAALFAAHPVHVEAVAWISERKEMASSLFWMLALGAYLFYTRAPSFRRYLPVAAAMALGLMSKATLVTLPLLLLLLDYWPLERLRSRGDLRRLAIEKAPLAALSLASSLATSLFFRQSIIPLDALGVEARLANAATGYVRYLRLFLWPVDLAGFYPHAGPDARLVGAPIAAAVLLLGITALAVRWRGAAPYLLTGWLWYLIALLPVIGLVQVGDQAIADRYLHIPSIGLSIALVWGAAELVAKAGVRRSVVTAAAAALVLTLALATQLQATYWRDSASVYQRAIDVTGGAFLPHYNLASELAKAGRLEEAATHYESARRFNPRSAVASSDLGLCYLRLGRKSDALAALEEALRLDPEDATAHQNLGLLLASDGRLQEAIARFRQAIEIDPTLEDGYFNLALSYLRSGHPEDAARTVEESIRLGHRSDPAITELLAEARRAAQKEALVGVVEPADSDAPSSAPK